MFSSWTLNAKSLCFSWFLSFKKNNWPQSISFTVYFLHLISFQSFQGDSFYKMGDSGNYKGQEENWQAANVLDCPQRQPLWQHIWPLKEPSEARVESPPLCRPSPGAEESRPQANPSPQSLRRWPSASHPRPFSSPLRSRALWPRTPCRPTSNGADLPALDPGQLLWTEEATDRSTVHQALGISISREKMEWWVGAKPHILSSSTCSWELKITNSLTGNEGTYFGFFIM